MGVFSSSRARGLFLSVLALVTGSAAGLNRLSVWSVEEGIGVGATDMLLSAGVGAGLFLLAVWALQAVTRRVVGALGEDTQRRYARLDPLSYLPAVLPLVGIWGARPVPYVALLILVLALKALLLCASLAVRQRRDVFVSRGWLAFLFLISGFAALIYQIVWQRTLFAAYGVNIESITIIVSLFMLGLGLGSLAGGALVRRFPRRALGFFLACQCGVGLFGAVSIPVIHRVAAATLHAPMLVVSAVIFALLAVPTVLMGATLPILVGHVHKYYRSVGKSVGVLYCINTIGSAIACFLTADVLFLLMGQQSSVLVAAASNVLVGVLVWRYGRRLASAGSPPEIGVSESAGEPGDTPAEPADAPALAPVAAAPALRRVDRILIVLFAAATGYISLTQEMLWMRVVDYMTGGRPTVFAHVLGFFLIGVAGGAWYGKRLCERGFGGHSPAWVIGRLLVISGVFYFLSIAATADLFYRTYWTLPGGGQTATQAMVGQAAVQIVHVVVAMVSFLLGGIFTILCHFAARSGQAAGSVVGKLYLANIVGCTLGPLLTSFVLMDVLTTQQIILAVSLATLALGAVALVWGARGPVWKPVAGVVLAAGVLVALYQPAYSRLISQLQRSDPSWIRYVVQDHSGIIVVEHDKRGDLIYGGGMYDGRFTLDPVANGNKIRRCYMIAALHPGPARALEVGLSGGSWARVMADYQPIRKLEIVEIGEGYQKVIRKYDPHKTLFDDPKVAIHIDDGRRWLNRHPDEKFDLILQNTTYHWRSHITNLLSREYLELCKRHLKPGGVVYYNTTGSLDVPYTAARVFQHVVRYGSFVAASDSPFDLTPDQIRANLRKFHRGDKPTFSGREAEKVLEEMATTPLPDVAPALRARKDLHCITDDNMASEYKDLRWWDPRRAWWKRLF